MNTQPGGKTWIWQRSFGFSSLIAALVLSALACNTLTGGSATADKAETTAEAVVTRDTTFGTGAFTYGDPTTGLAELAGYTATLKISFDGTRDGNPYSWATSYKELSAKQPAAKSWTIDQTDNGTAADTSLRIETARMDFEKVGAAACRADEMVSNHPWSGELELALFLSGVIGADDAGKAKANKIEAEHYTFDQHALGQDGISESTGELWVAIDGNYVVKYVLTTKGDEHAFGPGVDGTLSLDYELTTSDAPPEITLPDDCPPGFVIAPALADATDLQDSPGLQTYKSASSAADVIAFYEKELPDLGWTSAGAAALDDAGGFEAFTHGVDALIVTVTPASGGTTVTVTLAPGTVDPELLTP